MMFFTRGRDLADYVNLLSGALRALAQDMARISELTGRKMTEDMILDAYIQAASGPTIFERVLIEQGRMTEAEANTNHLAEMIYRRVFEGLTPKIPELKYYEVKFSDGNEINAVWMCIRGTDQPTTEEAQWFMASDSAALKLPVAEVCEIDEQTARGCYDFSNEADWPIFSKGGTRYGTKNASC